MRGWGPAPLHHRLRRSQQTSQGWAPSPLSRRKRRLVPVRFRTGSFTVADRRIRLSLARGAPALWVRLARPLPYPPEMVCAVTLLHEHGRLVVDVTATLPVEPHMVAHDRVAGVDLGIIHPFAVTTSSGEGLLVSGRALRAEHRLHLDDTKARAAKLSRKTPRRRGQAGSRRWRQLRAHQRKAELRHRRCIRQAQHQAAGQVITFALANQVGTLVVGDPKGICGKDAGPRHNLRLRQWGRTHLLQALTDKAERRGIRVELVDERGTSSTCPHCRARTPKPRGRRFACLACGLTGHRDLVGAANIAATRGGISHAVWRVTHRRVGIVPARRDRRRHLMDRRGRSCLAPGRPAARLGVARQPPAASVAAGCGVGSPAVEDQQSRPTSTAKIA